MDYKKQSLYTKYRPMNFDEVVGQKVAKDILINSIQRDKINHAYLFYGIRGTGKTTLARIFAKAINCNNKEDHNPCNACDICKSINDGSAFDIIEIDAASNNGVDEIRTIKENTTFLTTSTDYKVYIIDEVHMLSKAAFNALLKTLEEPPRNTIFLLATTELHKIPQTVLSRTVVINLEIMSNSDILQGLETILKGENVEYDVNALEYIIMTSGGSLRDAISALETVLLYNNTLSTENVISALGLVDKSSVESLLKGDIDKLINIIDESDKDPKKLSLLILEVIMHFVQNGDIKYVNVLNNLIAAVNTVKDPLLLKIALKSALYNVNVSRETIVDTPDVSRETAPEMTVLEEPIVESVENEPKIIDLEQKPIENKEVEIVDKTVENNSTPVENNVDNMPKKIDINALNIVTDYVDVNNYMYVIKKNDDSMLEKAQKRWKFKDSYITRAEYKVIMPTLMSTQPLAATEKSIIVGFRDEKLINEFKRVSLTGQFFEFMTELMGKPMFILPTNSANWSKMLKVKDNIELDLNIHSDIAVNPSDFVRSKTEETIVRVNSLFGEENISHE